MGRSDHAELSPSAIAATPSRRFEEAPSARLGRFLALDDFEYAARRHLPRMLHGFIAGAAETNASERGNRTSFDAHALVPRVLTDTSARNQATTLFGIRYAAPFGIAPMGAAALCAYRGDLALAHGAAAANVPMVLSASSLIPMEAVAAVGRPWYQAYLPGDAAEIDATVDRVLAAGFGTMVVTVDVPVPANRENNVRHGFSVPLRPTPQLFWDGATHPGWLFGTALRTLLRHGMPHFENMGPRRGPPVLSRAAARPAGRRDRLNWSHLAQIRRRWPGTLLVKGILSGADAELARDTGVDGIILSNHGGRQLDGAAAPLHVLPGIAARKGGMAVLLDGGIRRGTHVLKALALGADFVFVGRPFLFAAALGGAAFVHHAAALLMQEVDRDMALMGLADLAALGPTHLIRGDQPTQYAPRPEPTL